MRKALIHIDGRVAEVELGGRVVIVGGGKRVFFVTADEVIYNGREVPTRFLFAEKVEFL